MEDELDAERCARWDGTGSGSSVNSVLTDLASHGFTRRGGVAELLLSSSFMDLPYIEMPSVVHEPNSEWASWAPSSSGTPSPAEAAAETSSSSESVIGNGVFFKYSLTFLHAFNIRASRGLCLRAAWKQ